MGDAIKFVKNGGKPPHSKERGDEMSAGRREKREHMPTQLEIVRQVMLMAAQYDSWMTLEELARKTKFAETSIRRNCGICGKRSMARLRWRSGDG